MGLDQQIARLQNMESFNVYSVTPDGVISPWYDVTGAGLIPDLVIQEQNLAEQVQIVSAQIAHWGRHTSQCQRVMEIEERHYRAWRSQFFLDVRTGKRKLGEGDKKPTKEETEAMYRVDPDYAVYQNNIERAKEAHESAKEIVNAYKAKRDMLRTVVRRSGDGSVQLSV